MTKFKPWIARGTELLRNSLSPLPGELNEVDWKSGLSPDRERLAEHLSAFANHIAGGFLVFGIENVTGHIRGISREEADSIIGKLANLGRDALEPPIAIDHAVIEWGEMAILMVHIPEQPVKPVHRRGKSIDHTWIRSGGTTRKASRHEIGAMMMSSRVPRWEKLRASSRMSDEDVVRRLDIAVIARLLERQLPSDIDATMRWLTDENMVETDGTGYFITNLGAIAAARDLRQFPELERKRVRVVKYQGNNKVDSFNELVGQKGYAVGFEGLIAHLKHVLPHSEIIREALRTDVPIYPEIALRELIANALIHQDFLISGTSPMIEIYDDRIEFINPGRLLPGKTLDRLIGATPESRNELLASTFRRFRICEERGTGFQKIVSEAELFGLPPVVFVLVDNSFKVVLFAPRRFAEMSQAERVEACYQHAVIKYLSSSTMTNTSLRDRLKMHEKQRNQVSNLIADAVAAGRIRRKDPASGNKFAEYLPYWA